MKKILIFCCVLYFFNAKASVKIDSAIWVHKFMQQVVENQKERERKSFIANSYIKNQLVLDDGPDKILGRNIKYLEVKKKQLVWLNESYSQLFFKPNVGFKEQVEATKSYGKYPSWEFKSAAQLSVNFSAKYIKIEALSDKNFVSPLAKNAFAHYNFNIISLTESDLILAVVPKKDTRPHLLAK